MQQQRDQRVGVGQHRVVPCIELDGKYLELDAGHYPMLSDPDALVPLLLLA